MDESCDAPSLLSFGNCAGCAGKLSVELISQVVRGLPTFDDPNLLVGAEHCSDSGAYRLSDDLAILNTVDFFPPLVDDPHTFGRIAATNALSDVYAMGGEPLTALNIVCFPDRELPFDYLRRILQGGAEQVKLAGAVVVGGHSLRDTEVKYGMAITGRVDPRRMMQNTLAQPGDAIVLTKPLGTGFVTTALKQNRCPQDVYDRAVDSMTTLNGSAARIAGPLGVRAMTDVTGFGLSGHGYELASASGVTLHLEISKLPRIEGTAPLVEAGLFTRANKTNRDFVESSLRIEGEPDATGLEYAFDPQTSGGLLIAVAADRADELTNRCREEGLSAAAIIGWAEPSSEHALVLHP